MVGEREHVMHVCGRTKIRLCATVYTLLCTRISIHTSICVRVCVYVCSTVRGRCSHGPWITGLTLSILLNGKPICEHFSSQRSPRLILEWVGLIHRLPPPPPPPSPTALAFTTISIAINVSVPSSLTDWRGRIRDSCVVPACTTRPYTCYHSREIHMKPLYMCVCLRVRMCVWTECEWAWVLVASDREKGNRSFEPVFCLFGKYCECSDIGEEGGNGRLEEDWRIGVRCLRRYWICNE